MTAPRFPDEPIRAPSEPVYFDRPDDYEIDDDETEDCQSCGGDGYRECDEDDCFEADERGFHNHYVTCFNCCGSGNAKDQWFW